MLGFDVLLGIASLCSYRFIRLAKLLMGAADLFLVVAVVLIPIGYNRLGDECTDPNNSCGLVCSAQNSFGFFTLCSPWSIGTSMYLLIVGIILLFVASLVSSCIRSKTKYCMFRVVVAWLVHVLLRADPHLSRLNLFLSFDVTLLALHFPLHSRLFVMRDKSCYVIANY